MSKSNETDSDFYASLNADELRSRLKRLSDSQVVRLNCSNTNINENCANPLQLIDSISAGIRSFQRRCHEIVLQCRERERIAVALMQQAEEQARAAEAHARAAEARAIAAEAALSKSERYSSDDNVTIAPTDDVQYLLKKVFDKLNETPRVHKLDDKLKWFREK